MLLSISITMRECSARAIALRRVTTYTDCSLRYYRHVPRIQEIVEKKLSRKLSVDLRELEQSAVLAFVNSHPAIEYPEPLAPNVIEVSGLHIREPKPLPKVNFYFR